jgi:hypothetical protein
MPIECTVLHKRRLSRCLAACGQLITGFVYLKNPESLERLRGTRPMRSARLMAYPDLHLHRIEISPCFAKLTRALIGSEFPVQ